MWIRINMSDKSKPVLIPILQQMADFGTSEPFVVRISLGLCDLLNGVNIDESTKREVEDHIFETFQELSSAFISLRDIKEMETGKKPILLINQRKAYHDFYGYCWTSYKDRMPKIIEAIGINIGFLFGNDKTFNKGAEDFIKQYPTIGDEFVRMVADDRRKWQNTVSNIRNKYIQHKELNNVGDKEIKTYFNLQTAKLVFENCWQAIEDIVVMCLTINMVPGIKIGKIPSKEIDERCPKKFCFYTST